MATAYPTALDTSTQQPSPSSSTEMDDSGYEHDVVHTNHSGALIALETKLGIGSTTAAGASTNHVLVKQGDGDTEWAAVPTSVPTTITGADTTDTTCAVALFESATGDLAPKSDAGATYNAATGVLTATGFAGPLTGNVTGNCSGTAGSATGNAATATALATARDIGGVSFDGTGNITLPGVNSAGNQATSGNAATATLSSTVTVADTTDTTCNVALFESATGSLAAKTDAGVTYNAGTGTLNSTAVTSGGAAVLTTSTAAFTFSKVGDLVAAAGKGRLKVPMAVTVVDVIATCNTAPVGANAIFDVHKGGTTIFTTQGNRPTVAAGDQDGSAATPDVTAVAAGDVLTVDIDQIGSGTAGADATVVIRYTAA